MLVARNQRPSYGAAKRLGFSRRGRLPLGGWGGWGKVSSRSKVYDKTFR
jgi:hypothetical protein